MNKKTDYILPLDELLYLQGLARRMKAVSEPPEKGSGKCVRL
jgi:hypothetical protein